MAIGVSGEEGRRDALIYEGRAAGEPNGGDIGPIGRAERITPERPAPERSSTIVTIAIHPPAFESRRRNVVINSARLS